MPVALPQTVAPITATSLLVRPSHDADMAAITTIYAHAVLHGTGTFELEPPTLDDMVQRRANVTSRGWPWLVAERGGDVLGYAYANDFRPRRAYRFCLENSIYIADGARSRGIGRALLAELVTRCEVRGARQMLAVIGDSANIASIALHRGFGFEHCGQLNAAGWKFDRWLDVVLMQKALGLGSAAPASES